MTRTPEQVRRARSFLCRHNLWHRWDLRRVRVFGVGLCAVWVCERCQVAHPYISLLRHLSRSERS